MMNGFVVQNFREKKLAPTTLPTDIDEIVATFSEFLVILTMISDAERCDFPNFTKEQPISQDLTVLLKPTDH